MQTFLYDEYDVVVSIATISRLLQEKRWSKKETAKRAAKRSEALRTAWRHNGTQISLYFLTNLLQMNALVIGKEDGRRWD